MNKFVSIILSLMMLLCPSIAVSEGSFVSGGLITTVKKGTPAPFGGTLLNQEAVAELIVEKESFLGTIKLEVDHALEIQEIKHGFEVEELKLQLKYFKLNTDELDKVRIRQIEFLGVELEKRSDPKIEYWFVGGVLIGITTTLLALWATPKIK